jgi:hypothetical protein
MSMKDDQDVYEDQDTDERWPQNNCSKEKETIGTNTHFH